MKIFKRLKDNRGVGVVEVVLIMIIIIALVLLFQTEVTTFMNKALGKLQPTADRILEDTNL